MKRLLATAVLIFLASLAFAQDSALTIYNQNFAVVRQNVKLDLKSGATAATFSGVTAQLEPQSVVLRDPSGKRRLLILEQNYQSDPISQEALLLKYEGQTIDFLVVRPDRTEVLKGKIVRAGAMGASPQWQYTANYMYPASPLAPAQPIIEIDGQLRFGLPGIPLFPALSKDAILKPTLAWQIQSDAAGPLDAELSYVTGGMNWRADYNAVAAAGGGPLELVGWVTMENESGRTFENARIKLMAGDVSKVQPPLPRNGVAGGFGGGVFASPGQPPVTEKPFDEYHLYTLERPATLRNHETKQVEFLHAEKVKSETVYVYDGAKFNFPPGMTYQPEYMRQNRDLGADYQPKVWVMQQIVNSKSDGLGLPLPKGRLRFYRRDTDGRLEFTGENNIDHTPVDETLRIYTGSAFDLSGERKRTNFTSDQTRGWIDESFEIRVRNHKTTPVNVTVIEHLYRGAGWNILSNSAQYKKVSSDRIEFPITVPPGGEQILTYSVHYTW